MYYMQVPTHTHTTYTHATEYFVSSDGFMSCQGDKKLGQWIFNAATASRYVATTRNVALTNAHYFHPTVRRLERLHTVDHILNRGPYNHTDVNYLGWLLAI